jgi:hypothetical protein
MRRGEIWQRYETAIIRRPNPQFNMTATHNAWCGRLQRCAIVKSEMWTAKWRTWRCLCRVGVVSGGHVCGSRLQMYLPGHAVPGRILWRHIHAFHGPSRVPREIKGRHRWCLQPSGTQRHPGEAPGSSQAGHKLWHRHRLNRVLSTHPHRALGAATVMVML